ncbi:4-hydroxythreonine-4-phosphate dehydrogenase PdxA [Bordetella bronchiseptica MBORD635]|uniref:4-hydroxythreonine-4-phosphate dehydrogenase PdxA n=1 Tax=Bordetella bronchiseptica TaxID=518 RepID=UPI000460ECD3|nr:4-hydroxythreonine-4-phosphate dehydrogenase PdxA [Bordetella bronchiseptica]KDC77378.1 4-hydroxythreonine-4-phosphate dehydrogenase PdxA [Bordetella bronchiseptica MBORD635]
MTQDATPSRISTLAVTLGDVAGIGPEITAKMLLGHDELRQRARLLVVGDAAVLAQAVQAVGGDPARVRVIATPAEATNQPGSIEVIQAGPSLAHVPPGQLSAEAGDGSVRYVTTACALARDGLIDGIVTAPLNKAAMHMAGHKWPGHTELLAHEFGVKTFSLVLSAGDLYIFHATTHVSLRQAIEDVNPQRMRAVLRLAGSFARALGRADHPVAVAGLNPHAGENGIFGTEDAEILAPAVAQANAEGILAAGPIPADALFPQAVRGKWKFVIACYHDQGHAPFKSVYGDDGVNITVGLPVVRVSVDHGTAFDIAGKGIAREDSLVLAAERAAQLAPGWHQVWETARSTTGG